MIWDSARAPILICVDGDGEELKPVGMVGNNGTLSIGGKGIVTISKAVLHVPSLPEGPPPCGCPKCDYHAYSIPGISLEGLEECEITVTQEGHVLVDNLKLEQYAMHCTFDSDYITMLESMTFTRRSM